MELEFNPMERNFIGLEHKTIFTQRDDFDGVTVEESRLGENSNDLTHYNGAVLWINIYHKNR